MQKPTTAEVLEWLDACNDDPIYSRYADAAIEAVKAAEWRPIEEAPRDGVTRVLAYGEYARPFDREQSKAIAEIYFNRIWESWIDRQGNEFKPSVFRPLPAGPEVRG